jgi:hypothetical protein
MNTVSGVRPSTASSSHERLPKGPHFQSPPFQAIGIPAVAAAALKQPKPKHDEMVKDLPGCLRKENIED